MNFLFVATALLFYTKATETKECKGYVFTGIELGYNAWKGACEDLDGALASEDLKDSENAKRAKLAVDALRKEDAESKIFLGITTKDRKISPSPTDNYFVFSDGTKFDASSFLYDWADEKPTYANHLSCTYLTNDGKIADEECFSGVKSKGKAFCAVESTCTNSGTERSRANLSLFALFVAGGAFNVLHALAGLVF